MSVGNMQAMLTVADVARLRGCDHSTAWRLLVALEREHGAKLVRDRRRLRIEHGELQRALARMPPVGTVRLQREVSALRRRVATLEAEMQRFRQMSHEWFKIRRSTGA